MSGSMEPVLAAIAQLGSELGGRMDRLEGEVAKLGSDVAKLGSEVTKLRVDAMSRLDRQQDMLTTIRDDVGVNMAATGRVRDANVETRKDVSQLTEQVSVIHRRLIQLEERVDRAGGRP